VTGVAQGEVDFAATLATLGPAEGAKGTGRGKGDMLLLDYLSMLFFRVYPEK
jgi:hypothetical protein